jgi:hypothetical protein
MELKKYEPIDVPVVGEIRNMGLYTIAMLTDVGNYEGAALGFMCKVVLQDYRHVSRYKHVWQMTWESWKLSGGTHARP